MFTKEINLIVVVACGLASPQASAVAECRIKVTDVGCAVHISSLIVQRYNEFSPLLLQALQKQFEGSIAKGEEKVRMHTLIP